jgi:hypothetical protein
VPYTVLLLPPGKNPFAVKINNNNNNNKIIIGHEDNHSPQTNAEVKNKWVCTSIAPYVVA